MERPKLRCACESSTQNRIRGKALLFIQILAWNIILRHLVRPNFPPLSVPSVFHAHHNVGLERVSFFE